MLLFFCCRKQIFNVNVQILLLFSDHNFQGGDKNDLITPIKEQSRAKHPHANPSPLPKNALDRSHFLLDVPWLHLSRHFASCHFPSRPPGLHAPRAGRAETTLGSRRGCSLSSTAVQTGQWKNAGRDFACEKEELEENKNLYLYWRRDIRAQTLHMCSALGRFAKLHWII